MAKRRMFMENLIESDEFCSMPHSAQALYFHLNMAADDDGFVANPIRVTRSLCVSKKNFEVLVQSGFIILFDSGVLAITHWLSNNNIRKDRHTPTRFKDEFSMLKIQDDAMYIKEKEAISADILLSNDCHSAPQVSIGKDSIVKDRLDESSVGERSLAEVSRGEESIAEVRKGKVSEGEDSEVLSLRETEIEKEINKEKTPSEEGAFENDLSFSVSLSKENEKEGKSLTLEQFVSNVKLFIMTEYKTIDDRGFIDYYKKRGWLDENMKPILVNFRDYVRKWMRTHP